MRIKNEEWLQFKKSLLMLVEVFAEDTANITFPDFEDDNFTLQVNDNSFHPALVKKEGMLRVEYSFTLCKELRIRTLAFSKIGEAIRIEFSIKKDKVPCPVNLS